MAKVITDSGAHDTIVPTGGYHTDDPPATGQPGPAGNGGVTPVPQTPSGVGHNG